MEERIRTRLGDEGIDIRFDPLPSSPFDLGLPIEGISLPVRWLNGAIVDGPVMPVNFEGGFTFAVGDQPFRYDRWGLRQA